MRPTYPIAGTGAFAGRQHAAYHVSGQRDVLEWRIRGCLRRRKGIRSGAGIANVADRHVVADVAAVVVFVNLTVNGR